MMSKIELLQVVQVDYQERVIEIERYYKFVKSVDEKGNTLFDQHFPDVEYAELLKTLKANCFLLLYNLMEAVAKNTIQGIYDHLQTNNINYDECSEKIKRVVLKNIRSSKTSISSIYPKLTTIALHIVTQTFIVENLLPGSVDARSLRTLSKDYGILGRFRINGGRLLEVKEKRNMLAHGQITFNEAGRDLTINDLIEMKNEVLAFMQQFISNVDEYLLTEAYLCS